MNAPLRKIASLHAAVAAASLGLLSGCVTSPPLPRDAKFAAAEADIRAARSLSAPFEQRVAHYLASAAATVSERGTAREVEDAQRIYNAACAELTILLRSGARGRHWHQALQAGTAFASYQLRYAHADDRVAWSPDAFTSFVSSNAPPSGRVTTPNRRAGVGGTLVGVRSVNPREAYASRVGITAAVTATLDFRGPEATLTLANPVAQASVQVGGTVRPLAADFSAPLCFYPPGDPTLTGLLGGFRPAAFASETGLYLVQPFDPKRIPIIFVHGLISTPYIWVDVINKIQMDPVLRERYQCVVFAYPTGNPVAYSGLEFRQWLARFEKSFPLPGGYLIISHSLGGLLAQMQTTKLDRATWERTEGALARQVLARMKAGSLANQMLCFRPNPQIKRVVFIATPHRGTDTALGWLARFAERLIALPGSLAKELKSTLAGAIEDFTGNPHELPDGISGLSPKNPLLLTMATTQVVPPCHSIIGNRGLAGPLAQSSDGIVPYWSSHLPYAKSEVIVPGPHSCYDYPGSITELKRILHLHLETSRE